MVYIRVKDADEGGKYLGRAILGALNKDLNVLWLVSGGSNTQIGCEVRRSLPDNRLKNLKMAQVDERFGNYGHKDSNYTQLQGAGFDFNYIDFVPVLTSENLSFERTAQAYEQRIKILLKESDMVIGQFGIGHDGHTAGILPHSVGCAIDHRLVIGYQAPDFKRITLSFKAIGMIDEAYIFAFGEDKLLPLSLLRGKEQPLSDQPAQIFRQSTPKSYIINNMIGDRV